MSAPTITPTAIDAFVLIESIRVVDRHRKNLGDLEALAASITDVGLLNPITLTRDSRLVAGQRRLEACRRLGWESIPVRFIDNLDDAAKLLRAERDENTERKEMLPSEKASLGEALYAIEERSARERMAEAGRISAPGRPSERCGDGTTPLPGADENKTRHLVGEALGMSGRTYSELAYVHRLANNKEATDEERSLARAALAEMDRTGSIAPPARRVRGALRAKRDAHYAKAAAMEPEPSPDAAPRRPGADPNWIPAPGDSSRVGSARRRDLIRELAAQGHTSDQIGQRLGILEVTIRRIAHKEGIAIPADDAVGKSRRRIDPNRVIRETVHALDGLAMGVSLVIDDLDDLDAAEMKDWAVSLADSLRVLNRLNKKMKEMTQ